MSFEGFYQTICVSGHYNSTTDAYCFDNPEEDYLCLYCKGKLAWWNLVDVTNGSWDGEGNRIDGYIEVECIEQNICECPTCGVKHRAKAPVFAVPKEGGHKC
jgi:hypothetical protein